MDASAFDKSRQQIQKWLSENKFRKARDEAKLHLKAAPEIFKPLLVEANVGLAKEMAEKGMHKEAMAVLEYLKSIAPPEVIVRLQAFLCGKELTQPATTGKPTASASASASASSNTVIDIDNAVLVMPAADQALMLDLIVNNHALNIKAVSPAAQAFAADLECVRTAQKLLCQSDHLGVNDALRPISRNSVFNDWRTFLRGCSAFYQNQMEKCEKFFGALPEDAKLRKASRPYLMVAALRQGKPISTPSQQDLKSAMELLGEGEVWPYFEWISALPYNKPLQWDKLADKFIVESRAGRVNAIRNGRLIGELFAHFASTVSCDTEKIPKWIERLSLEDKQLANISLEHVATLELLRGTISFTNIYKEELIPMWQNFVTVISQVYDLGPRFIANGLRHLAKQIPNNAESVKRGGLRIIKSKTSKRAVYKALFAAQSFMPDCPILATELGDAIEQMGDETKHRHYLDEAIKTFPEHKELLIRAARLAYERKTWDKGLKAARKALDQDPINPEILDLVDCGLNAVIMKGLKEKRGAHLDKYGPEIAAIASNDPNNWLRSKWLLGIKELIWRVLVKKTVSEQEISACLAAAPGPTEAKSAIAAYCDAHGVKPPPFYDKLPAKILSVEHFEELFDAVRPIFIIPPGILFPQNYTDKLFSTLLAQAESNKVLDPTALILAIGKWKKQGYECLFWNMSKLKRKKAKRTLDQALELMISPRANLREFHHLLDLIQDMDEFNKLYPVMADEYNRQLAILRGDSDDEEDDDDDEDDDFDDDDDMGIEEFFEQIAKPGTAPNFAIEMIFSQICSELSPKEIEGVKKFGKGKMPQHILTVLVEAGGGNNILADAFVRYLRDNY